MRRHRRICSRGRGQAIGMAVEISCDRWASITFGAHRGDKRGRIDFEPRPGVRRHIARWRRCVDPVGGTKQQSADLVARVRRRQRQHRFARRA
ncbi:MAG: hypothetical protein JWO15_924 [Sphingomonadales bacterium]|nr:hypothetical protein [Sphingomonadales bacterium]